MCISACNQSSQKEDVVSGVDLANMDSTAVPGDNFYQFACGGWIENHPLKPEYSRFGTFNELGETSQEQVKGIIEELGSKENESGSNAQKIGDLYSLAMDSSRLNTEGGKPLADYLAVIDQLADKSALSATIASMFRNGAYPFFGCYVYADDKNSSINIFHITQGGYGMGDRDYYIEKDDRSEYLRQKYTDLIGTLFTLAGYPNESVAKAVSAVMKIETRLAKAAYPRVELRIPEKNYHKISIEELRNTVSEINWDNFFVSLGLSDVKELNLSQPEPLKEVNNIIKEFSLEDLKYYLIWKIINSSTDFLSDEFIDASFEYYGKALSGREELRPRWKRSVDMVSDVAGEAIGQLYVEKYFPPVAKERMLEMVKNLQTALGERIDNLAWMSDETKEKAQEKLGSFHVKIGYPDKWKDYSSLIIDKNESYLTNIIRANNFEFDYMLSKFNQPVDKDEWLMNPQTVNAYYNPSTNEICFPAAILQPPFFNLEADDAVNYGAIGVVIGHEMTHGFDDQGRQFDKDGNLKDWWTEQDAEKFKERAQVLIDFFNNIVVLDTVHANGELTLGENIADHGGLQVSWQAYQNSLKGKDKPEPVDGFTNAQRFFLGYATVWASSIRDEEILRLTKIDPHSLGKWRVNGALPHIDVWYEAFDVKEDNQLFIPKEERASIW